MKTRGTMKKIQVLFIVFLFIPIATCNDSLTTNHHLCHTCLTNRNVSLKITNQSTLFDEIHSNCSTNENNTNQTVSDNNKKCQNKDLLLPCQQPISLRYKLFAYLCGIVLIVGIVGNSITVFVIISSPRLRSQVAFHFLASLAIADIGVSFFATTMNLNMYLHNNNFCHSLATCSYFIYVDYLFPMSSVTHLFIVAIDRFTAIKFPFEYSRYFTKGKVRIFIVSIWLYTLFWSSFSIIPLNKIGIVSTDEYRECYIFDKRTYITSVIILIYIIPMFITTALYCIILFIAMRQSDIIRKQTTVALNVTNSLRGNNNSNTKQKHRSLRRDLRAAKTISVVFAAYTICWLPHFILVLISYSNSTILTIFFHKYPIASDVISTLFHKVLPLLNSCLNPFLYFLLGSNFRSAFKDVVYKFLGKSRYRSENQMTVYSRKNSRSSSTTDPIDERKMLQ